MTKRAVLALAIGVMAAVPAVPAQAAEPVEVGPCGDPDAIVITVGQTAKVCVYAVDTNECDSNDVYVRVGGRTYCVRVP